MSFKGKGRAMEKLLFKNFIIMLILSVSCNLNVGSEITKKIMNVNNDEQSEWYSSVLI